MIRVITNILGLLLLFGLHSCVQNENEPEMSSGTNSDAQATEERDLGQAGVKDDVSEKNILQIAVESEDHSTLETAVQAAEMEHVLTNAGPLTVFAPTNAAFDKLPEGPVEDLLKPENQDQLKNIIEYHAAPGSYGPDRISGVEGIGQANMQKVEVTMENGETYVNGHKVLGSAKASNGWVHVIDGVLLPPEK